MIDCTNIKLDWPPKVEAIYSGGARVDTAVAATTGKLQHEHLSLLNWNRIFFDIQQMKNERSWYNMEIGLDMLRTLMNSPHWYELTIPKTDLEFHDFGRDLATMNMKEAYGKGIVKNISKDLQDNFPEQKGFSVVNLHYMKRWCLFYQQKKEIFYQPGKIFEMPWDFARVPWRHHVEIISKCQSVSLPHFFRLVCLMSAPAFTKNHR